MNPYASQNNTKKTDQKHCNEDPEVLGWHFKADRKANSTVQQNKSKPTVSAKGIQIRRKTVRNTYSMRSQINQIQRQISQVQKSIKKKIAIP